MLPASGVEPVVIDLELAPQSAEAASPPPTYDASRASRRPRPPPGEPPRPIAPSPARPAPQDAPVVRRKTSLDGEPAVPADAVRDPAHQPKSSPTRASHLLARRRPAPAQHVPKPAVYIQWRPRHGAPTAADSLLCAKPKYAQSVETHVSSTVAKRRLQVRGLKLKPRGAFPKGKVRPRSPKAPPRLIRGTFPKGILRRA